MLLYGPHETPADIDMDPARLDSYLLYVKGRLCYLESNLAPGGMTFPYSMEEPIPYDGLKTEAEIWKEYYDMCDRKVDK